MMTPAKKKTAPARKTTATPGKNPKGLSAEELAAMKEHLQSLKAEARRGKDDDADREAEVLAKIAALPPDDRALAERLHALIKASAPILRPKTWYGMPAYAMDDKLICFFQGASKFKARYATLGFSDKANLDKGRMWPTSYALTELTADEEAKIMALVKQAIS